jgi:hypothetical protein
MARGRLVVLLASVMGVIGGAAACNSNIESNAPAGKGDTVFVDVDASMLPPSPSEDAAIADSPFARVDGSGIYGSNYDAYAVLSICEPPDAGAEPDGGGSNDGSEPAADGAVSASSPADGAASGCVPFPAECASEPDCICLFRAFAAQIPCSYPSCGVKKGFTINCPP